MLVLVALLTIGVVLAWRPGGPLLAMLIAWLVCTAPIALGVIEYDYLAYADNGYIVYIGASILAAGIGALLAVAGAARPRGAPSLLVAYDWHADFSEWAPVARVVRTIALVAIALLVLDALSSGRSITDLQALRVEATEATQASWLARIASVLTWACFFSFVFALYFRHLLPRAQFLFYLVASLGIVIGALTSAGRQAVFQLVLLTLTLEYFRARRLDAATRAKSASVRWVIVGLGIAYLVFVTIVRTSGADGRSKADLLLYFFNAHLNPTLERLTSGLDERLTDTLVELLLYATHSVALFSRLILVDFGRHFYGALDFPFLLRQLEPITGLRVIDAFDAKSFYLKADSVIGVGWTTAFSALLMDFGAVGGLAFLMVQGYLGQRAAVEVVARAGGFGMVVSLVLAIVAAIYLPYLPLFSDSNMFFLLLVTGGVMLRKRRVRSTSSDVDALSHARRWQEGRR